VTEYGGPEHGRRLLGLEPMLPPRRYDWLRLGEYAAGVGFPAAVALYLLVRLDRTLVDLIQVVWALKQSVDQLTR